jgi:hypothetical protein
LSRRGAAQAGITRDRWWSTGFEMLMLGGGVAVAAYGAGALAASLVRQAAWEYFAGWRKFPQP